MPDPSSTPKKKRSARDVAKVESRTEPRTSAVLGWSPDKIRSAETQVNAGYFVLAADLCETMMSDDRVSQALDRLYAATTLPLVFQLPGVDSEQSKDDPVVQALDTDWWRMLPEETLRDTVAWLALLGVALLHVDDWAIDPETKRVVSRLSVWSPKHLRQDTQTNTWKVRSATSAVDWAGTEGEITPGDGRWIVVLRGSNWRGVMKASWRGIARWWLVKQYATVDWPSSSERHGQGTAVAVNQSSEKRLSEPQRKSLATDMAGLKRNGVIVMPDGFDYKLVTDPANSWTTFKAQTEMANLAISIGLVGTNLTTEVKGGSYAAASVHESVDAQKMRGLVELLATTFRDQLLVWWAAFNFGDGAIAPYPHWDTTPPADVAAQAETHVKASTALRAYLDAGLPVDGEQWSERFGVPITDDLSKVPRPRQTGGGTPGGAPPATRLEARAEAKPEPKDAFERGAAYVAELERKCCDIAAKELVPTVAAVMAAIEGAESYEDAKARLLAAYQKVAEASRLVGATEAALIMGQLAGRETVEQELQEE